MMSADFMRNSFLTERSVHMTCRLCNLPVIMAHGAANGKSIGRLLRSAGAGSSIDFIMKSAVMPRLRNHSIFWPYRPTNNDHGLAVT